MSVAAACPRCGAPLTIRSPQGLCPACLLQAGLEGHSTSGPAPAAASSDFEPAMAMTLDHVRGSVAPAFLPERPLPEPGERYGSYQILRILGKGGMGAVFEADQLETGRRVALKVLKHSLDSSESRKRFLREGRLAASINHPNSVYVYGTEEIHGTPAIAMELVAGGTLQERVKKQGPLPIGQAVDTILQIIAGLEAAQKLGVLHRDIKPANCFIDIDGTVKVGDFGLSISTAARGETDVTQSGAFLGTPAFSSPEQLRGDELNVRSDIYSVGVTLYYLLTGRTPFEADNVVKLLATVLEQPARSPRKFRPEIPNPLAAVVLRCLQKQSGDRFQDYADLRRALLPFASAAPTPATLGLRFAAGVIDGWILFMAVAVLEILMAPDIDALANLQRDRGWFAIKVILASALLQILYFAVPEGLWGLTPGKAFCGLRVVGPDRIAPGILRALARAAIFSALPALPAWLRFALDQEGESNVAWFTMVATWSILLLMFVTARRRNGYAALHDLASGTRVVSREAYQTRAALAPVDELPAASSDLPQIGPYHVLRPIGRRNDEQGGEPWLLGYDTRLLRRVWIHRVPSGTPPVTAALRNLGRIGRLRWLTGVRSPGENWDAYEAPSGEALLSLLDRSRPWSQVRFWLLDLADELTAVAKQHDPPMTLALDRVWITADARAKLLDFPAPGIEPLPDGSAAEGSPPEDPATAKPFLRRVAVAALEGRVSISDESPSQPPAAPLPIRARTFFQSLPALPNLESAVDALRTLAQHPAEASRGRRLLLVLGCCLPSLAIGALFMLVLFVVVQPWSGKHPELTPLLISLSVLEQLEKDAGVAGPDADRKRRQMEAMEIYIAYRFGPTIASPSEWDSVLTKSIIAPKHRALAERVVAARPQATAAEFSAAKDELKGMLPALESSPAQQARMLVMSFGLAIASSLIFVGFGSLLTTLTFRRGPVLRSLGLDIVTRTGAHASRPRLLLRSLIAWSPVLLAPVAMAFVLPALPRPSSHESAMGVIFVTVVIGCAAYLVVVLCSALLPHRGIPDRLAGTWLVPW